MNARLRNVSKTWLLSKIADFKRKSSTHVVRPHQTLGILHRYGSAERNAMKSARGGTHVVAGDSEVISVTISAIHTALCPLMTTCIMRRALM